MPSWRGEADQGHGHALKHGAVMNITRRGKAAEAEEERSSHDQPPRGATVIVRHPSRLSVGVVALALVALLGVFASGCRQCPTWPGISLELSLFGVFVDVVESPIRVGDDDINVESIAPTEPSASVVPVGMNDCRSR